MKKNMIFVMTVLCLFLLNSCNEKGINMERTQVKVLKKTQTDKKGKIFYSEAENETQAVFKWLKQSRVSIFSEPRPSSSILGQVDIKEFVEIVSEKPGESYARIRAYDKVRGYIEGYVKVHSLFDKSYYSEPYQLTPEEIKRRKDLAYAKMMKELSDKAKDKIKEEEIRFENIISRSKDKLVQVIGSDYQTIVKYLSNFKKDNLYAENAEKTIKLDNNDVSIYISMVNGQATGFKIINNNGLSSEEADMLLYETTGEIFYTEDYINKINDNISKSSGVLKKSLQSILVKKDMSKFKHYLELTVGDFSGIE